MAISFDYYQSKSDEVKQNYTQTIDGCKKALAEVEQTPTTEGAPTKFTPFFREALNWVLTVDNYQQKLGLGYFTNSSFDELKGDNYKLFQLLDPSNYAKSYLNPVYAVQELGKELGQAMSYLSSLLSKYVNYLHTGQLDILAHYNSLLLKVFAQVYEGQVDPDSLLQLIIEGQLAIAPLTYKRRFNRSADPAFTHYIDLIEEADLSDLRYLFMTGGYITENEVRMAKFLNTYPDEKLEQMGKVIARAYKIGFVNQNKQRGTRKVAQVIYRVGLERIYRYVLKALREEGFAPTVEDIQSSKINKQVDYDHEHDLAVFMNDQYLPQLTDIITQAFEENKELDLDYSGVVAVMSFGEEPFSPAFHESRINFDDEGRKLYQGFVGTYMNAHNKYKPRSETSFTIVAFPSPEVGGQFEEIFEKILEINMVDSESVEVIQQKMIDVFDTVDYVHIKGKGTNRTDLRVQLPPLQDPTKQSNFINGGADLNIPVGEIFTSPQLAGTTGVLHVHETYQDGLKFKELSLTFEDGYVTDYSCANFEDEEQNKTYIRDNLLMPHQTLPMGEFAIGTNTLAYVVSEQYKLFPVLPVLIMEKTGPHFAIGDTCFARSEDHPVYNRLTNKEVVARDNEKSCQRKENPSEAYTFKHNDITLAFEDIEFIQGVRKSGEKIDVIRDGRFVLEGTELLNEPLDQS